MPVFKLECWSRQWRLRGDTVECRACTAKQPLDERGDEFAHDEGCPHRIVDQAPWDELDSALQAVKQE